MTEVAYWLKNKRESAQYTSKWHFFNKMHAAAVRKWRESNTLTQVK